MSADPFRDQIDAAIRSAPESVNTELLQTITSRIGASIEPVTPLRPGWVLVTGLVASVMGVATAGAAILGFHGIRTMSVSAAAVILCSLAAFTLVAAVNCVRLGIPGSRILVTPVVLVSTEVLALAAIFAACFDDYGTEDFVAQGLRCLIAGLIHAVPAALLAALILRRCFPVDTGAAMLARGALAGLAGIVMLALHCARLEVPHLAVWHTAVLPVSAMAGLVLASAGSRRRRLKR